MKIGGLAGPTYGATDASRSSAALHPERWPIVGQPRKASVSGTAHGCGVVANVARSVMPTMSTTAITDESTAASGPLSAGSTVPADAPASAARLPPADSPITITRAGSSPHVAALALRNRTARLTSYTTPGKVPAPPALARR